MQNTCYKTLKNRNYDGIRLQSDYVYGVFNNKKYATNQAMRQDTMLIFVQNGSTWRAEYFALKNPICVMIRSRYGVHKQTVSGAHLDATVKPYNPIFKDCHYRAYVACRQEGSAISDFDRRDPCSYGQIEALFSK